MVLTIAFIADIHFGAYEPDEMYRELQLGVLYNLLKLKSLDMIVIGGDLFHKKLSFNDPCIRYALDFVNDLIRVADRFDAVIRVIKGTRSHDCDQLNNFHYLEENSPDRFRVIKYFTDEVLVRNGQSYRFIYIPEEYINKSEYQELLSTESDICFLHGTFDHVGYVKYLNRRLRYPLWNYSDFSNTRGPVLCGHVHKYSAYKNKIIYSGSFSRWCFGEEEPKGFVIVRYDARNGNFKHLFVENKRARRYVTVDMSQFCQATDDTIEQIRLIEQYKNDNNIYALRLNHEEPELDEQIMMFKNYTGNKNIVFHNTTKPVSTEPDGPSQSDEYEFIFNDSLDIYSKVSLYIEKSYQQHISRERIIELLDKNE